LRKKAVETEKIMDFGPLEMYRPCVTARAIDRKLCSPGSDDLTEHILALKLIFHELPSYSKCLKSFDFLKYPLLGFSFIKVLGLTEEQLQETLAEIIGQLLVIQNHDRLE
jgi:hypothetical protein